MKTFLLLTLTFTSLALFSTTSYSYDKEKFAAASVVMPVTDIEVNGTTAHMTIPNNAKDLKKKAQNADYFALRIKGESPESTCPKTSTSEIDKTVKDYDLLSGSARIKVEFSNKEIANQALAKDCVIIKNNKK